MLKGKLLDIIDKLPNSMHARAEKMLTNLLKEEAARAKFHREELSMHDELIAQPKQLELPFERSVA